MWDLTPWRTTALPPYRRTALVGAETDSNPSLQKAQAGRGLFQKALINKTIVRAS